MNRVDHEGVAEEVEELEWYQRVSWKRKYGDLLGRAMRDPRIEEDVEEFPIVRKSVGSIRIPGFWDRTSSWEADKFDHSTGEVLESERVGPWHLLDVTPTSIEEIADQWILERIAEEGIKQVTVSKIQKVRQAIFKFMKKRIGQKAMKKEIDIQSEIFPEREFQELCRKFRQTGNKEEQTVHWKSEESINNSVMLSNELALQVSTSNFTPEVKSSEIRSVESLDQSKQISEFSGSQDLLSNVTILEEDSSDLDERFRITQVLSDFSLQKRVLIPDECIS